MLEALHPTKKRTSEPSGSPRACWRLPRPSTSPRRPVKRQNGSARSSTLLSRTPIGNRGSGTSSSPRSVPRSAWSRRSSSARSHRKPHGRRTSARRSVSRVLSHLASRRDGDGHPSGAAGRPTAHAADPRAGQRTSPPPTVARPRVAPSYLALLRVEFARFTPIAGLRRRPASSLWHWSSPHGGRALPATLRCGARTFLTPHDGSPHRRRAAIRPPR